MRASGLCDQDITVASVYLHIGEKDSEDNLQLLAVVAEMVQRPGGSFVVGGATSSSRRSAWPAAASRGDWEHASWRRRVLSAL